eukprot:Skav216523  [mRNA]  locus=scaffold4485:225672:227267:- [translate_table: standard]
MQMGASLDQRDTFAGLKNVDRSFSMEDKANWTDEKSSILRTAMNGTFFTRDKQFHSGKFATKTCPWCDAEDNMLHRYWECPFFGDLRRHISSQDIHTICAMPSCTHLHGWFTVTDATMNWERCLEALPTTTDTFEHVLPTDHDVHLFVDGGCHGPHASLKLGTWAVAAADLHADKFLPVAQGFVPGKLQTSMRAELTAITVAVGIGTQLGRPFYLWTDSQVIFNKIHSWLNSPRWPRIPRRRRNADLWTKLLHGVRTAFERGLFQTVLKVRSHQDALLYSDLIDRWAVEGNNFVDAMTAQVLRSLSPAIQATWDVAIQEYTERRRLRDLLHQFMYEVGLRAITAGKQAPRDQEELPQPVAMEGPVDSRDSVAPLPDQLPEGTRPKSFGPHCDDIFRWLHVLQAGEACNTWMSSYQLFAHFQFSTGMLGYHYRDRGYHRFSDSECAEYSFIKGAGWLVSLLKVFCSHFDLPYVTDYKVPGGVSFHTWHRCVLIKVSAATVAKIDSLFASAGVRYVRKISTSFGQVRGFWEDS